MIDNKKIERYSEIKTGRKREMLLLKGKPCTYGKCSFCNYILDNSLNEEEMNEVNKLEIEKVTGKYGILEVVNSGSVFELTFDTLILIRNKCVEKNIKTIYFEAYFSYMQRLEEIIDFFKINNIEIRFRIGIETFDDDFRINVLNKNFKINTQTLKLIKAKYHGVLLMICLKGQTKDQIINDIEFAINNFNEVTISVFVDNGTNVERDKKLVKWFVETQYEVLVKNNKIEILIDNKDLGVFVQ